MSLKIMIKTEDSIIKKAVNAGNSARLSVPKEWDDKEVLCIPLPEVLEDKIPLLFEQEMIIINNNEVFSKTVKNVRAYEYAIFIPKRYIDNYIVITLKN